MSRLTEAPPETVRVNGHLLEVLTDWRQMVRFEVQLMRTGTEEGTAFVDKWLRSFYVHPQQAFAVADAEQLWNGLLWFYRCGRKAEKRSAHGGSARPVRAYDFEQDAALILAAFQQAYGIDLTATRMHWWRFRALFDGLPADCRICKIMEYRTADTTDMPEKTRAFYQKMQQRYRLQQPVLYPRAITVEEHNAAFIQRITGR